MSLQLIYARPFTAKDAVEFTVSFNHKDFSILSGRTRAESYTLTLTPRATEVSLEKVSLVVYEDNCCQLKLDIRDLTLIQDIFFEPGRALGLTAYLMGQKHLKTKPIPYDQLQKGLNDFCKWGAHVGIFQHGAFDLQATELLKAHRHMVLAKDPLFQDEERFLKTMEGFLPEFQTPLNSAAIVLLATQPSYDESVFAKKDLIFALFQKTPSPSLDAAFAFMDCLLCETDKPKQQRLLTDALPKLLEWATPQNPLYLNQLTRLMAAAACRSDIPLELQAASSGPELTSALFALWVKQG